MSKFEEIVNELVGKMEQGEDGKFVLPEEVAKDLDEPTMYAVTAERRRRDTQGAFTRSQQELKKQQAIADGITDRMLNGEVEFTAAQKLELNELKTKNPEAWRKKVNEYEAAARENLRTELQDIAKDTANKTELEIRQDQMAAWSESTGINLTNEIVDNELPPRFKKELEDGKVTFEEFLNKAGNFLKSAKIIQGSNESTDDDTLDLGRIAGGKEPSKAAKKGDFLETYKKTIF